MNIRVLRGGTDGSVRKLDRQIRSTDRELATARSIARIDSDPAESRDQPFSSDLPPYEIIQTKIMLLSVDL
jgi:hypothetical protein